MLNLVKTQQFNVKVESTSFSDAPISASTWDFSNDSLICAFGPSEGEGIVELIRLTSLQESLQITYWRTMSGRSASDGNKILNLHCLADSGDTCVVFEGGDIVLVRQDPVVEVEIVGSAENKIVAAAWSPDDEVLALLTNGNSLLLMSRDFEPIEEVILTTEDLKASRHVSVGWGKSETQFQGKHAKAMRDPTMPEKVDRGERSPQDDGRTSISWRGDGAFLAVSSFEGEDRRVIRVYNREAQLDSVSEPVDGLESHISWRPAGNLIAGIQRFPDRVDVVFFERNGLRHGEFTLKTGEGIPSKSLDVRDVLWNGDSTILAVCLADRVQLWSMGNYHWYLKQELMVPVFGQRYLLVGHPEKPLKFAIISSREVFINKFIWKTAAGSVIPPNDNGVVGVIDGDTLMLTPLKLANIPPPMSLYEVKLRMTPIDVAINQSGTVIAVLQHNGIDLIDWGIKPARSPVVNNNVISIEAPLSFSQLIFVGERSIFLLGENRNGGSVLRWLSLGTSGDIQKDETISIDMKSPCAISEVPGSTQTTILCQTEAGEVFEYALSDKSKRLVCKFSTPCPWMDAAVMGEQIVAVGLSEGGRLYANDRLIASSCTSFTLTAAHLIFTTNQHVIKFIHLTVGGANDLEIPPNDVIDDERCRNIERGSRLVSVLPSSFSLVLQMPRGNLETIYPRALVLAGVRKNIEARKYKMAFIACRNNRVDLNLLHDYAPTQFLECIELFVEQLKKVEHIDLFLSQLREEDVTKTMYRETLGSVTQINTIEDKVEGAKVNRICDAFIDVLLKKYLSSNMQNILTAYVCKTTADHESALSLIISLKGKDLYDQAITHICFLSDVNKLYDTALGIYDLGIALTIAQQAQKDPREYLPFLQSLQAMDELRRKFTIDDRLGRTSKALGNLYDMGKDNFEEVRRYAAQKELYSDALHLYKYDQECLKAVMRDYADFLFSMDRYREAGLAYEFLKETVLATECYQKAGMWQECLYIAASRPLDSSGEDIQSLSQSFVENLLEIKDYPNAARVYLEHLNDVEEAVRVLCKGSYFADAMRTAMLKSMPSLLSDVVDPALMEAFGQISELLSDCKSQLITQTARICELRKKVVNDPLSYFDPTTAVDAPDNVSLAPTNASTSASLFTRYTGATLATALTGETRKTSKNRRKEERKRARGKKGSVYEEEYLVNSVHRLIERVETTRVDAGCVIDAMVRRGMWNNASVLQAKVRGMVTMIEGCIGEVFVQPPAAPEEVERGGEMRGGFPQPTRRILQVVEMPLIKKFEGLSLL